MFDAGRGRDSGGMILGGMFSDWLRGKYSDIDCEWMKRKERSQLDIKYTQDMVSNPATL